VIEQTMIFALGFLVAGLVALAFAPAFWRRANRLTRRQLEMQIPLSVQEILAERDQLRAEFAVECCRLEQRTEQLDDRHAADLVNLGHQATKISELEAEIAGGLAAVQAAERERIENATEMNALRGEFGALQKALYDSEGLIDRRQNEFLEYVRLQESMKVLSEMRFAALAASDARVASLELRLGEVSRSLIEAEQKLSQRELHTRSLTDVLGGVRSERQSAEARVAELETQLAAEAQRAGELAQQLAAVSQQQDGDLNQLKTLMVKMNVNEAALEESRRRELDAIARRDHMAERAREAEKILEDYARLRAEHSAAQGALDVARKRGEELANAIAQAGRRSEAGEIPPSSNGDDNAALRQSISEIGAAIIRQVRPNGDGASAESAARFAPIPGLLSPDSTEPHLSSHEPAAS
jgi:chromosome segregation ATPase